MFQRLTSLFFSTPPPPEDPECPRAFVSEEDEVDGWLIIDLPGETWVRTLMPGPVAGGRAAEGRGAAKGLGSSSSLVGKWGLDSDTEGRGTGPHPITSPGGLLGSAALGPTPHVP